MKDEKLFDLYEKLYFHEAEVRDKISNRLQIPLALVLSISSVYALLIRDISLDNLGLWHLLFFFFFSISCCLFATSFVYFIRSFYGHTYLFLPSALDSENYRLSLIDTYSTYDECDELVSKYFNEYIYNHYNKCSSANTLVNDKRSERLHKCNTYLILNALPLFITFLIFTFSGIDRNSIDKELKVHISNPIEFDLNNKPIKIDGHFDISTLEIDLSNDLKEMMNERIKTDTTTTSTTSSSTNN